VVVAVMAAVMETPCNGNSDRGFRVSLRERECERYDRV